APTGTISGPATLTVGQFGTFAAHVADNTGGSGIDASSLHWAVDSQTASGASAQFAFSTTGSHTIVLTFKDLAGNAGQATLTVTVTAAAPTQPPSGTGLTTTSTGGTTIGLYRAVTITGRKGRFIP